MVKFNGFTAEDLAPRPFAWEQSYPPNVRWDAPIAETTLSRLLDHCVARFGPQKALSYRNATLTYRDLAMKVDIAAQRLAGLGVRSGDRVALYLPNTPWHPILFFAIQRLGAIAVHLSPLDAAREISHKLKDSGAETVITTDLGNLDKTLALSAPNVRRVVLSDLAWSSPEIRSAVDDALARAMPDLATPPLVPTDPNAIAALQYTGGTTGLPKGAILTHSNFTSTISIFEAWGIPQGLYRYGEDVLLGVLPLFHIYALTVNLIMGLQLGVHHVMMTRFDADEALNLIERHGVTAFNGVPTMWIALANHPGFTADRIKTLRTVRSGGAPCPIEIEAKIDRLTGLRLAGGWGMTETSPAGTNIPTYGTVVRGTIGLPLPGLIMDVVALDDPTRKLKTGETGELRIKGPNVTPGYWNADELTANAFVDGYFLTGDVGYMDPSGLFFLVDRKKDMIISGGFNVYPRVIEEALYEHPAVAECIVIGVPDDYRGEAAKAFITLKAGAEPPTLDTMKAFLADKIGKHEMPAALEVRQELPRTAVGKLSKKTLQDEERAKRV
jgi:long-chain acyl-CoA synthetase